MAVLRILNEHILLHKFNYTHVVLVPKCDNPEIVSQLRPIRLCNVIVRIASTCVANRMKCQREEFVKGILSLPICLYCAEAFSSLIQASERGGDSEYSGGLYMGVGSGKSPQTERLNPWSWVVHSRVLSAGDIGRLCSFSGLVGKSNRLTELTRRNRHMEASQGLVGITGILNSDSTGLVFRLQESWQSRAYEDCILDMTRGGCVMRHDHHKSYPMQSEYVAGTVDFKKESVPYQYCDSEISYAL
ncbi:UNVERIFIED_CONTAM: hypothetical protein Scaly_3035700 [Sesamum calycinum]|uniref:Uncharacterized protein n=1 Tax=Sesamum calycinum TaxID=2727403 RepID=A0AAW2K6U5_9LAMI